MPNYAAFVSLMAVLFHFYTGVAVARARAKFGVKAPAISGHPDFERYFRVQANTLEWMPIFLPSLWLFALYVSDMGAAGIGLVWILGRVLYFVGYTQAAAKRGRGFALQAFAATILLFGALIGVAARILALA